MTNKAPFERTPGGQTQGHQHGQQPRGPTDQKGPASASRREKEELDAPAPRNQGMPGDELDDDGDIFDATNEENKGEPKGRTSGKSPQRTPGLAPASSPSSKRRDDGNCGCDSNDDTR